MTQADGNKHIFGEEEARFAAALRMLSIDAVQQANSGHPGLPLGAADIVATLWSRAINFDPRDPTWRNRDRFVLSAGHGSALLYALLHLIGTLPMEEVVNFRQWGSETPGHPELDRKHGIEMTTGPLGQGISSAVGMALAERWKAARFNQPDFPIIDHYTYVLASDGDLMEGVSHEAASFAGSQKLGKLIVFYDDNNISIDGKVTMACNDDATMRFEAYGWHTARVDGHDMNAIAAALKEAQSVTDRPSLIACKTLIGLGSPKVDTAGVHGSPLGDAALDETKEHYGWPVTPRFYVPDDVRDSMKQWAECQAESRAAWDALVAKYRDAHPDLAAAWDKLESGDLPVGWELNLPVMPDKPMATRNSSGFVLDTIMPFLPMMIGGSADLTGSVKTRPKEFTVVTPETPDGNYIYYGIREFGMGAIMNGIALHGGLRPFGGTFLQFADYNRASIRLAALMGIPTIFIFTHDSIGLGEDGPTHQPIEHLTTLRVMPNLVTLRPADSNETKWAWQVALERVTGPTTLILTRQDLPLLTPDENLVKKGAYILREAEGGKPDLLLLATGSEVSLAVEAREALLTRGIKARVVSMPSWELFDAQPADYRDDVIPSDVPAIAIEAGSTLAWARYVGRDGRVIGIDHFGASAPAEILFEKFGLTVENIVHQAEELVG